MKNEGKSRKTHDYVFFFFFLLLFMDCILILFSHPCLHIFSHPILLTLSRSSLPFLFLSFIPFFPIFFLSLITPAFHSWLLFTCLWLLILLHNYSFLQVYNCHFLSCPSSFILPFTFFHYYWFRAHSFLGLCFETFARCVIFRECYFRALFSLFVFVFLLLSWWW